MIAYNYHFTACNFICQLVCFLIYREINVKGFKVVYLISNRKYHVQNFSTQNISLIQGKIFVVDK